MVKSTISLTISTDYLNQNHQGPFPLTFWISLGDWTQESVILDQVLATQIVALRPAPLVLAGKLLKMQNSRSYPRSTELESMSNKIMKGSFCTLKFEMHTPRKVLYTWSVRATNWTPSKGESTFTRIGSALGSGPWAMVAWLTQRKRKFHSLKVPFLHLRPLQSMHIF